jgi:hypothetical protein
MTTSADGSYVYAGGHLYLKDAAAQWHEWIDGRMVALDRDPTAGLSPEGVRLLAGSGGELVTLEGAWTFGIEADAAGNRAIFINDRAAGGRAVELAILGGRIHARVSSDAGSAGAAGWYLWAAGRWVDGLVA